MDDQRHAPADLPPGKTRYPLYRRMEGPQGGSGRVRKISPPPPPELDPRTVQLIATRYTDWAIPGHHEPAGTYTSHCLFHPPLTLLYAKLLIEPRTAAPCWSAHRCQLTVNQLVLCPAPPQGSSGYLEATYYALQMPEMSFLI